jgi:hypothetical protein
MSAWLKRELRSKSCWIHKWEYYKEDTCIMRKCKKCETKEDLSEKTED